jgi:hypothetical protein
MYDSFGCGSWSYLKEGGKGEKYSYYHQFIQFKYYHLILTCVNHSNTIFSSYFPPPRHLFHFTNDVKNTYRPTNVSRTLVEDHRSLHITLTGFPKCQVSVAV